IERAPVPERVAERAVDADEIAPRRQNGAERPADARRERARPQIVPEEALVDAGQRTVGGGPVDQMLPQLRERRARPVEPERLEVLPLADLGALAVADRELEQFR